MLRLQEVTPIPALALLLPKPFRVRLIPLNLVPLFASSAVPILFPPPSHPPPAAPLLPGSLTKTTTPPPVDLSFAGTGPVSVRVTVAVLEIVPVAVAWTTTVMTADVPTGMLPSEQGIVE